MSSDPISADVIVDGDAKVIMTVAERTKLAGIPEGGGSGDTVDATSVEAAGALMKSGGTMTGMLTLPATLPSDALHAVTKSYVEGLVSGFKTKTEVAAATTGNVNLNSITGSDGYTFLDNDRVLVRANTNAAENGIYDYDLSTNSLTRSSDADTWDELVFALTTVVNGATYANAQFISQAAAGGTLNTTAVPWAFYGQRINYVAGTGIFISGSTIALSNTGVTAASYGSSTSVATFTVGNTGRISAASNTSIAFPVTTVAGKTGAVTLDTDDVSTAADTSIGGAARADVTAVVAHYKAHIDDAASVSSAHAADRITVTSATIGGVAVTDVQDAVDALDSHVDGTSAGAHAASRISVTAATIGGTAVDDVQDVVGLFDAHIDDATAGGAHTSARIAHTATIEGVAVTDVDAAIDALLATKMGAQANLGLTIASATTVAGGATASINAAAVQAAGVLNYTLSGGTGTAVTFSIAATGLPAGLYRKLMRVRNSFATPASVSFSGATISSGVPTVIAPSTTTTFVLETLNTGTDWSVYADPVNFPRPTIVYSTSETFTPTPAAVPTGSLVFLADTVTGGGPVAVTFPDDAVQALPQNWFCYFIARASGGATYAAGTDATLSGDSITASTQNALVMAWRSSAGSFRVFLLSPPRLMTSTEVTNGTSTERLSVTPALLKAAAEAHGAGSGGMTTEERDKLAGIAAGAEVNPDDATSLEITTGTGTATRLFTPAQLKLAAETWGGSSSYSPHIYVPKRPRIGGNVITAGNVFHDTYYSKAYDQEGFIDLFRELKYYGFTDVSARINWREAMLDHTDSVSNLTYSTIAFDPQYIPGLTRFVRAAATVGLKVMIDFHSLFNSGDQKTLCPAYIGNWSGVYTGGTATTTVSGVTLPATEYIPAGTYYNGLARPEQRFSPARHAPTTDAPASMHAIWHPVITTARNALADFQVATLVQLGAALTATELAAIDVISLLNEPWGDWDIKALNGTTSLPLENGKRQAAVYKYLVDEINSRVTWAASVPKTVRWLRTENPFVTGSGNKIDASALTYLGMYCSNMYLRVDATKNIDGVITNPLDADSASWSPLIPHIPVMRAFGAQAAADGKEWRISEFYGSEMKDNRSRLETYFAHYFNEALPRLQHRPTVTYIWYMDNSGVDLDDLQWSPDPRVVGGQVLASKGKLAPIAKKFYCGYDPATDAPHLGKDPVPWPTFIVNDVVFAGTESAVGDDAAAALTRFDRFFYRGGGAAVTVFQSTPTRTLNLYPGTFYPGDVINIENRGAAITISRQTGAVLYSGATSTTNVPSVAIASGVSSTTRYRFLAIDADSNGRATTFRIQQVV